MQDRIDKPSGADNPDNPAEYAADFRALLALGPRLVGREITTGQWVTVARLLQANLVSHWDHLGVVVDMPGPDAKAGFIAWLGRQADLYQQSGAGLTADEAAGFQKLADALPGGAR